MPLATPSPNPYQINFSKLSFKRVQLLATKFRFDRSPCHCGERGWWSCLYHFCYVCKKAMLERVGNSMSALCRLFEVNVNLISPLDVQQACILVRHFIFLPDLAATKARPYPIPSPDMNRWNRTDSQKHANKTLSPSDFVAVILHFHLPKQSWPGQIFVTNAVLKINLAAPRSTLFS